MSKTHPKNIKEHIYNAINPSFAGKQKHLGMPTFDDSGPALSFYEFWSTKLFYTPIAFHLLYLCLRYGSFTMPTIANPLFPMGGFVGESKRDIFKQFGKGMSEFALKFTSYERKANDSDGSAGVKSVRQLMKKADLSYPVVIKPDMGCRGVGVQLIKDDEELRIYIESFPVDGRMIVQELVPYEGEAGVFYIRLPEQEQGIIFSITLKYFPYVVGDGHSTLRQLIEADRRAGVIKHVYLHRHRERLDDIVPQGQNFRLAFTGSHSRGTIFRNGNAYISEPMRQCFDSLARHIPEFYFGRFDVRFSDYRDLQAGRGFKIVEINGAGAEATHIWDRKTPIWRAYATLFRQNALLFKVANQNRRRGYSPCSLWSLIRAYIAEKRLTALYPHTE